MFYTGKGDDGTTKLYGDAERYPKAGTVLEALGSVDDLDTFIGVCRAYFAKHEAIILPNKQVLTDMLHTAQETLFIIQAELAGADKSLEDKKISDLETTISAIEATVPKIQHFTIPGGTYESALLDRARAMTRTTERRIVAVKKDDRNISSNTLSYINRLSSLFFALARYVEYIKGTSYEAPSYD